MSSRLKEFLKSEKLTWAIIIYGVILRVVQYLYNRSLYIDEARDTVVGILGRSFTELFAPPPDIFPPSPPVGFFIIEKLMVMLIGNNEYALRMFPLFTGIVSLFIFYYLAKQYIKAAWAVSIVIFIFAVTEPLIRYSTAVRPYSSDVMFSTMIIILALYVRYKNFSNFALLSFTVAGMISVWFSHPVVFVLAGTGMGLFLTSLIRKEWKNSTYLLIVYFLWISSFVLYYNLYLHYLTGNEYFYNAVKGEDAFLTAPILSVTAFKWIIARFFGIFKETGGIYLPGVAAIAFIIGCIALYKEEKEKFLILILPLILTFILAIFAVYPFRHRMVLFLVPILLLFIAKGIEYINETTRKAPVVLIGFVGFLLFHPVLFAGYHLFKPLAYEEIKPVLTYIKQHWQEGDIIYLHYRAHPAFAYYAEKYGFRDGDYIVSIYAGERNNIWAFSVDFLRIYTKDLDKLRGKERVWILFSGTPLLHKGIDERIFFRYYLNTIGRQIDAFESTKAAVYLYDLSKGPLPIPSSYNNESPHPLHWNF